MNKWLTSVLSIVSIIGLLGGCATPNASVEIQGEVWFKERIALPSDAVLSVQVSDVSLMDAPAVIIAELERTDITTPVPFQFMIPADQFEPGHSYVIGAKISLGDKLLFITTQSYPIDIGAQTPMSVLVQKVGR
jgi:putative lipoprotein